MWQYILKKFSLINIHFLPQIITSLLILLAVIIIGRLLNVCLLRWQKSFVDKFAKKNHVHISAFETKFTITRRIINAAIYFFAFIFILLQFEAMRNIATGLLASAGIAGIIIGMAAQNTLSNVIAGISISFSQPVRLKDAVIFENEFGWVEEISLMHTIILTWDNRRIMVPNNVLVNKVIENWTIKDTSLLGIVMLYVDYTCDVDKVRQWVKEIVDASPYSTAERIATVEVVDFSEKTMQIRILSKGSDSSSTWSLRCEIREKLIKKFREAGIPLPRIANQNV